MVRQAYIDSALMKSVDIIYHILEGGTVGCVTCEGLKSVQSRACNTPKKRTVGERVDANIRRIIYTGVAI